jgi:hypothetical protein
MYLTFSSDIWEDIAEECSKYGNIIDMKIPRPHEGTLVPGCGLVSIIEICLMFHYKPV